MKKISGTISKLIGKVCPTLSMNVELKAAWSTIVGSELEQMTEFDEAKYKKDGTIVVLINVLSSATTLFKYQIPEITNAITKIVGNEKVKLISKQVSEMNKGKTKDAA